MKKILIVDDSITVARHMEQIVAGSGDFEVVGYARNGAEALRLNEEVNPEIICMDMNMPVMDGLAALRSLVRTDPQVKVVMISSLGGVGDKCTEALKLGARQVVSKPFDADSLLSVLRGL